MLSCLYDNADTLRAFHFTHFLAEIRSYCCHKSSPFVFSHLFCDYYQSGHIWAIARNPQKSVVTSPNSHLAQHGRGTRLRSCVASLLPALCTVTSLWYDTLVSTQFPSSSTASHRIFLQNVTSQRPICCRISLSAGSS